MQPFPRRTGPDDSLLLTAADTDRLLARHGAHAEAPAVQHAITGLLAIAAGPPSDQELAGEVAAVAAFVLAASQPAPRPAHPGPRRVIAAGLAAAAVVAFSAAAAANALPAPVQELAHTTFGAPAPRPPAPAPALPAGQPAPKPGPGPGPATRQASPKTPAANPPKPPAARPPAAGAPPKAAAQAKPKGKARPPGH